MQKNLRPLTYTALMTAFVFVTTSIVKIPIPFTNGYIHAGDMSIFIGAILLGPLYGAFLGGVGSALADFLGGYAQWILPTLIIKAIMGYIAGYFATRKIKGNLFAALILSAWAIVLIGIFQFTSNIDPKSLINVVEGISTEGDAIELITSFHRQILSVGLIVPIFSILMKFIGSKVGLKFVEILGMLFAGIWMCAGYYIASGLMYGSYVSAMFSIPWNVAQFIGGSLLAFVILNALKPTGLREHIRDILK